MLENMDEMLTRVREYVFQTDEALKESQRHTAQATGQHETAALKQIREDIWQLEDKVRAAKWATSPTEQAELANQIDPLMLRVMEKCQKHRDQVQGCQGLLNDIVNWCERGTSAYRFAVHESAVTRAPSRYSSGGGSDPGVQGKTVPSRIPAYKSPTKQPKGQPQPQQQQHEAQSGQQQQLMQVKANSRIPTQPQSATRKSLPDTEQQGSSPDQLAILQGDNRPSRRSSTSNGGAAAADSNASSAAAPAVGPLTSGAAARIAALNRSAAASAAPPAPAAGPARGGGVLVAAAAAAFGGSKAAAPKFVAPQQVSSSGGGGAPNPPPSSTAAGAPAASGPAAAPAAPAPAAPTVESFMPLDLDAEDGQLLQPPAQQQPQQGDQQQQERLSRSSGSSVVSLTASRGSGGRSSRSLLQLEPSRDDVSLSSAGQLAQQSTAAAEASTAAAAAPTAAMSSAVTHGAALPPTDPPAGGAGGVQQGAFRFSGSLHGGDSQGRGLQLRVPRPSNTSDASTADFSLSMNDFPEFGPLRSFTPMVSHNGSSGASAGRSHPFALMTAPGAVAGGGGGAGSSSGYGDRGSLRTSQDISMLLRSGMLMEAALLSSNASRMHVIHDAVAKKPSKPQGEPEVPVVPSRLAVHKKRPWWAQAARVVVGTAAMAVAGAAGAAAAKHHQGEGEGLPGLRPRSAAGSKSSKGSSSSSKQQQPLALEEASSILPFAPLGPAPDASAGCG